MQQSRAIYGAAEASIWLLPLWSSCRAPLGVPGRVTKPRGEPGQLRGDKTAHVGMGISVYRPPVTGRGGVPAAPGRKREGGGRAGERGLPAQWEPMLPMTAERASQGGAICGLKQ